MKIIGTKSTTETIYVSNNSIWSTKEIVVYRTFIGISLWKISTKQVAYKFGEPYIAKI